MNNTEVTPLDPLALEEAVQQERVRLFLGKASDNLSNVLMGAGLLGWILNQHGVPLPWLQGWGVTVLVLALVWMGVDRYSARINLTAANRRSVLCLRMAAGGLLFLMYGISPLLLSGPGNLLPHTWIMMIVSTAMTVNAISYATMPQYWLVLNVASMLPLSLDLGWHAWALWDLDYLVMMCMTLVWQVIIMLKVRGVATTAVAALEAQWRLRLEVREHERTRAQIQHMAMHDDLTGLANRRYFEQTFNRSLHQASRGPLGFAVVVLDLDDFKSVNDTLGHAAGDEVLRAAAQRLQRHIRAGDFAARLGGDEFAVLLSNVRQHDDVLPVLAKLRAELGQAVVWQGHTLHLGCSMGWATFPHDSRDPDRLLSLADERMYEDKAQRRERQM
jgi:diguanylate cyclase (GGDEF)-like protein